MISDSAVSFSDPAIRGRLVTMSEEELNNMADNALAELAVNLGVLPMTSTLPERASLLRALLSAASSVG